GTVDEIDVGKLTIGMLVEIKVGAIPNKIINGKLERVSPKAHRDEGSTLFDIEISLNDIGESFLRAGYSANADIIITKKTDIILIPERLVNMSDSIVTVEVQDTAGNIETRDVTIGLSDGINIEIATGLVEGELIVERPPKEIE
ncbi:MAG: efflux RND transporter periplasmic adaptor subunit, partial [Candidatus Zixiibacteriota bacterium]